MKVRSREIPALKKIINLKVFILGSMNLFFTSVCALAVFGETEQIGIPKTIDIDRLIHVWIIK